MLAWSSTDTWNLVGYVVVPVLTFVGGVLLARRYYRKGKDDRATERAEDAAAVERRALAGAHPTFAAQVHAVAAGVTPGNPMDPVKVNTEHEGIWLHAVDLSWRYSADPESTWRAERQRCEPLHAVLPAQLTPRHTVGFTWPGEQPPEQAQHTDEVWVTWGLGPDGLTAEAKAQGTPHSSNEAGWQGP